MDIILQSDRPQRHQGYQLYRGQEQDGRRHCPAAAEHGEAGAASNIVSDDNVTKVSIVGAGMETHPGVAAEMFEALFSRSVNIQMISTSEIKISVLINKADGDRAVEAIHEKFFENQ